MKTFINASVLLPDEMIAQGYLTEYEGKIVAFGTMDALGVPEGEIINCKGCFLSPGFVDIHLHGGGGFDFMDGTVEAIVGAARAHLRHGTTTMLPTTLTCSDQDLFACIANFKAAQQVKHNMPHLPGLHLEGPYFDAVQKGAQDERYIQMPTKAHYQRIMQAAEGTVLRWSVAPELAGALEMANELTKQGVVFSAGHTAATYAQMQQAMAHGYQLVTHWYSGMSTIVREGGFRVLGVIESVYCLDGLCAEIIADGMHLPPELLQMIVKCKNLDELCLVTDSMRGADMPDGLSVLGGLRDGQTVLVEAGIAKTLDKTSFAGSVATTDRLVRVMHTKAQLSLVQAVKLMTLNPAKFVGLADTIGSIAVGKQADLVLFDADVKVHAVYVDGVAVTL